MCAKILQRHFSKLTFICDYPMHYYHIEQLGSKVGEGMWRDSRWVLRPHLSLAVFGLNSRHQTFFSTWCLATRPASASIAALRTRYSVQQEIVGRSHAVGLLVTSPILGCILVSNLHGMPTHNQPTKIILKYLISFCFQICTLFAIIIIIISLGILALNFAWKFMIRILVRSMNPVSNVIEEISKLRKIVGI